nr:hypothetical protein GCM10020092_056780 [Actinoplanes digitatis]
MVFEVSLTVFAVGSVLCGLAQDMTTLIWARVIQGLGGGGLIVTAMALVADIIPLRYRGRYQGTLGAVFGITTMAGPTLGGILTDQLSWRWVFYINLPVTIVVLAIAVFAIPSMRAGARPVVDYAGIVLVALGSASLILAVSWAGDEYEWDSAVIIGLITTSVVLFVVFVQVELKAREPVLPMRLFRNSVFVVCSALSFIVGFAMLGAMTVLPTYLQYVDGMSATASGLRLLPMVAGVFTASTCSGKLVRRTGRYRIFPVTGTAVMTLGLWLMSTMSSGTGAWRMSAYLFVLGTGIGMTMQVLTIVVQNTATYTNLGTVSASMTYVRAMGGAFGAALFGTLFRDKLSSYAVIQNSGAPSPTELYERSAAEAAPIIEAYAGTISYVFVLVAPRRPARLPGHGVPQSGSAARRCPLARHRRRRGVLRAGPVRPGRPTRAGDQRHHAQSRTCTDDPGRDPEQLGWPAEPVAGLGDGPDPPARPGAGERRSDRDRAEPPDTTGGPATRVHRPLPGRIRED